MQTSNSEFNNEIDLVETTDPGHADTFNPLFKVLIDNDVFLNTTKANLKEMLNQLAAKVDKVNGKQLSTNDYTTTEKSKLAGIQANANNYVHPATHPAAMIVEDVARQFVSATEKLKLVNDVYTKNETDLRIQSLINNAPDALDTLKEISEALNNDPNFANTVINQLAAKVDKVNGKQLSTNDYTTTEKSKLAGIQANANNYVHPATHPAAMIVEDVARQFVSSDEKTGWNNKLAATANAVSASKLQTGRTIALSGDVAGNAVFDGSSNIIITATVADNSHAHIIANIAGLQTALDGKAKASHTHSTSQVIGLDDALNSLAPLASPALTGVPTAPTAAVGSNNTQLATTAFATRAAKEWAVNKLAKYGSPVSIDPNETTDAMILTNHTNGPNTQYWYIRTYFYSSLTGNRAQFAVRYHQTSDIAFRNCYGGVWTEWKRFSVELDGKADKVHTHTIANIADLQKALDSKETPSAAQTKANKAETNAKDYANEKFATKDDVSKAGYGDMLKSTYDKNGDGIVDEAKNVSWGGITNKPSTFAPSTHNHQSVIFTDSRAVNFSPFSFTGLSMHIKQNAADGLNDGGNYHGVLHMAQWNDASGGRPHQLGFTDNGNIYFRQHTGVDWTPWKKLAFDEHEHIQSGTYTGNATANRAISLGYRPKYVKIIGNNQMFELYPTISQITPQAQQLDGNNFILNDSANLGAVTATGFTLGSSAASKANANGKAYTYIAFN